jgi:hypothetical protein
VGAPPAIVLTAIAFHAVMTAGSAAAGGCAPAAGLAARTMAVTMSAEIARLKARRARTEPNDAWNTLHLRGKRGERLPPRGSLSTPQPLAIRFLFVNPSRPGAARFWSQGKAVTSAANR